MTSPFGKLVASGRAKALMAKATEAAAEENTRLGLAVPVEVNGRWVARERDGSVRPLGKPSVRTGVTTTTRLIAAGPLGARDVIVTIQLQKMKYSPSSSVKVGKGLVVDFDRGAVLTLADKRPVVLSPPKPVVR